MLYKDNKINSKIKHELLKFCINWYWERISFDQHDLTKVFWIHSDYYVDWGTLKRNESKKKLS